MAKRRVVLTGAAGYLADRMLPVLRERYDLVLLDVQTTNRDGEEVEGIVVTDLRSRDRDRYREYFRGADAIVHCAFVRSDRSDVDDYFSGEIHNVTMAYNVYQVCVEEGVRRAVIFSSNHAADYYETLIWADRMEFVTPEMRPAFRQPLRLGEVGLRTPGLCLRDRPRRRRQAAGECAAAHRFAS